MLDTGNILQLTSQSFQEEMLTIGEYKAEPMLTIRQVMLFDGEGQHRKYTVSNADYVRNKTDLLSRLKQI